MGNQINVYDNISEARKGEALDVNTINLFQFSKIKELPNKILEDYPGHNNASTFKDCFDMQYLTIWSYKGKIHVLNAHKKEFKKLI